jgi:MFS family permease
MLSSKTPSEISWIGAVQGFLLVESGIVAGPLCDKGYLRHLLILGSFLLVFGLMMVSISTEYYQIFLAQSICVGLGMGFLFTPGITVVTTYFSRKQSVALGIAATGGGLG